MGVPNELMLLSGGRWIKSPSSLSSPPAYGGTVLGNWQQARLRVSIREDPLLAEEYGGEEVDSLYLGEEVRLEASLSDWDSAGVVAGYVGAAAGAGVVPRLKFPGATITRGKWLTDAGAVYLWAAYDTTTAPSLLVYNAYPVIDPQTGLPFSSYDELGLLVAWRGVRDASGRIYDSGLLAELSL